MTDRSGRLLTTWVAERQPGGWRLVDAALAAAVLVVLVGEVLPNPEMTPRGPLLLLVVAMAAPLAWRHRRPGTVALLVAVTNLGMSLVSTGPFAPQFAIVPILLSLYGAASRLRGRQALVVGGLTLVLMVAGWIVSEEGHADDFWPWLLWAAAWATGTLVRRRGDVAAQQAARAALMEVEARNAAAESAQQERDRIARELHDVVAHSVSVMVVQAGAERLRLGPDPGRTGAALEAIEDAGRAALAELRNMLGVMRGPQPDELAPLPTLSAIPDLVDRVRAAGLSVSLVCEPSELLSDDADVGAAVGLAAYRIVQESLTNVVRHAGPVDAEVSLRRDAAGMTVCVHSAAPTVPPESAGAGRGILGMRERVAALGGTLTVGPDETGFRVHAVLPLADGVHAP